MSIVMFTVEGEPVPWSRAGQNGRFRYTPAHVRQYQDWIRLCAREAMQGRDPISGPVRLTFTAVLPIPQSFSAWKRQAAEAGLVQPAKKPDLDNLEKTIADASNGIVWDDDRQVCASDARKIYGAKPRLEVRIEPMEHVTSAKEWNHLTNQETKTHATA